ncbi:MAG: protein phosphatase 2C domain-containing protein [Planctomycetes bacterium]|nr:protein phosphatase 2C domain-containing protein [Planctomycetota bacterium]
MSEPTSPKTGGLWARLFSMASEEEKKKMEPHADSGSVEALASPLAPTPVAPTSSSEAITEQEDRDIELLPPTVEIPNPFVDVQAPVVESDQAAAPFVEPVPAPPTAVPAEFCRSCGAARKPELSYCDDCGWMFPDEASPAPFPGFANASPLRIAAMPSAAIRIKDRYEVASLISERQGVRRYRGLDHGQAASPVPVVIVCSVVPEMVEPILEDVPMVAVPVANGATGLDEDEILPGFDEPMAVGKPIEGTPIGPGDAWPNLAWEKGVLDKANHPSLPAVVDAFTENNFEYLIEELPQGRSLWDAWDDADVDGNARYGWLEQLAQGMDALHKAGAVLEGVQPDLIVVTPSGQAMVADITDLLPLPLPASPPIRATHYTAPELILNPESADARATLYSFGAMLYSLEYLHHVLEDKDFEHQFSPKQITNRYPDAHPLLIRLVNKTFVRDPNMRFPTDESVKTDPSGMAELVRSLETCRRTFDNVRLDIAAWTTTGMVRTGNEDAFAVLHGIEARQDDLWEYAMVLLCDGMGGYEAGEVAAAMAIQEMRKFLLAQPMFASLTGKEPPAEAINVKACQDTILAALKQANREIYTAARVPGRGRRGMGCTAECVYVDAGNVIVGHVGDSRTYHLRQGRLVQLTRDQTLVNRLVELGQLTSAEAENHPRKNELQQAIGGQPDVAPNLYAAKLKRGDWVLVCSDGLTNHVPAADLEKMLTREAAYSAEEAARRLLNLVNLRGATDNATIVVIRAN